jgi:hypothetical protein
VPAEGPGETAANLAEPAARLRPKAPPVLAHRGEMVLHYSYNVMRDGSLEGLPATVTTSMASISSIGSSCAGAGSRGLRLSYGPLRSNDPESHSVSGRLTPRWSVLGQFVAYPSAGLSGRSLIVFVGPPLSASGSMRAEPTN